MSDIVIGLLGNPATIDPLVERSKGIEALAVMERMPEEGAEPPDTDNVPKPDSRVSVAGRDLRV